ncbi:uncharacterized protein LOC114277039 [Camellia sinensis]|uniref:uncharacterized protein LOC114277039 n=1 Tax=Camellia sinensis TaxID=4442 RepID=UPI001036F0EE|nr:uncharacterized protein LOC114277039 [Camellia sinensis]
MGLSFQGELDNASMVAATLEFRSPPPLVEAWRSNCPPEPPCQTEEGKPAAKAVWCVVITHGGDAVSVPEVEVADLGADDREQRGELGAVAAGTFALYKKHQSKKDPEHAHKHKIEEEIAAEAAVGSGGYAFHEHHEKKNAKEEEFLVCVCGMC